MLRLISSLLFLIVPLLGYATHIRGGEMRVVSSNGLAVRIELKMYTNTDSEIFFGDGNLEFGDGSSMTTPQIGPGDQRFTDLGNRLGMAVFTIVHAYSSQGYYILRYTEPNLSWGILNVPNSVETRFQVISGFLIDANSNVYVSPEFPTDPIFRAATNADYSFSTAASDVDNDCYYRYSLVTAPPLISGYSSKDRYV